MPFLKVITCLFCGVSHSLSLSDSVLHLNLLHIFQMMSHNLPQFFQGTYCPENYVLWQTYHGCLSYRCLLLLHCPFDLKCLLFLKTYSLSLHVTTDKNYLPTFCYQVPTNACPLCLISSDICSILYSFATLSKSFPIAFSLFIMYLHTYTTVLHPSTAYWKWTLPPYRWRMSRLTPLVNLSIGFHFNIIFIHHPEISIY